VSHLWRPLAAVTGLLLLLTYLLLQSRSPDLAARARMQDALQAVQLHDAELTRDVLLARAGLLPHYDSLSTTGAKLGRAAEALRESSEAMAGAPNLGRRAGALAAAVAGKMTLVEYFKSDNALLRNSSTYFTHAGQVLGARAGVGLAPVGEIVAAASHAMLGYIQTPDPAARQEIDAALGRLTARAAGRSDVEALVAHGRLVVDVLPQVDAALREIITTPTAVQAEAMQDAVLEYDRRVEARAQVFRLLLYLVAIVLLGYLLYQVGQLRARARELRASEERFRAITESAGDAIVSADASGRIVSWNARAEAIFGYPAAEILGAPLARLLPERVQATHGRRLAEWSATDVAGLAGTTLELAGRRKDGSEFPLDISLSTWSTARGRYVTGIIRDLTARKQLEETTRQQELQLIQANKMTALGTLVSGVAHEINNPNHLVLMNARVLADAWTDAREILDAHRRVAGEFTLSGLPYAEMRDSIPALVDDIQDGARRIERIINDLKGFARPSAGGDDVVSPNQAVERAVRLLAHAIRSRTTRFQVELGADVPPLTGDAQHVEQIVVNLILNALEALPSRDRGVSVRTWFDEGEGCVVLEVQDEGTGIAPEHLARVCDPFFTTKQSAGGTGLGLAITSSLVRLHRGRLTFASEPDRGTRARVAFPSAIDSHAAVGLRES
jgi:PAS domain S-box-containing protein